MKFLNRSFTTRELVIIILLVLVLLGAAYYQFVDTPVRNQLAQARSEKAALETQLNGVYAKIAEMKRIEAELDDLSSQANMSVMYSYNNSEAELRLLNDILTSTEEYTVSFSNVTRDGDQIRRRFTLTFTAADFAAAKRVITRLSGSELRCLVDNITYNYKPGTSRISITAAATFYETMAGATPDAGLPGA